MDPDEFWKRMREERSLSPRLREEFLQIFGERGKKALDALDSGRVLRYRDFVVVSGSSGQHIVEEGFCTCHDHLYRGGTCWHLLAVRLAELTGTFRDVDGWFQETWTKKST